MLKNFIFFFTHKFIFVTNFVKLIYFHCFSTIIIIPIIFLVRIKINLVLRLFNVKKYTKNSI